MMTDKTEIHQNAGLGAHGNTFIAEQNNGLSVEDATTMAFTIFREYYPQLREEMLSDLYKILEEKLKNITPENIIPPSPRIAVPTLQNASITEDISIRELYAQLLANSMDATIKDGVHPDFVEIINQLSPDEAKLLRYLFTQLIIPTVTLKRVNEQNEGNDIIKNFSNIGELAECENPLKISEYFDNLLRLGLLESSETASLVDKALYNPLKEHEYILSQINIITSQEPPFNKSHLKEGYMAMTDFGRSFCKICLPTM